MSAYQLTSDPDVVLLDGITVVPRGHRWWDDYQIWLAGGNTPAPFEQQPESSIPTVAELQSQLAFIQHRLAQLAGQANADQSITP